jgi:hypothetical protein
LDHHPTDAWVEEFDSHGEIRDFRATIRTAYGRPLVVRDGRIIWSVHDDEVQTAVSFVKQGVASVNLRFSRDRLYRS